MRYAADVPSAEELAQQANNARFTPEHWEIQRRFIEHGAIGSECDFKLLYSKDTYRQWFYFDLPKFYCPECKGFMTFVNAEEEDDEGSVTVWATYQGDTLAVK